MGGLGAGQRAVRWQTVALQAGKPFAGCFGDLSVGVTIGGLFLTVGVGDSRDDQWPSKRSCRAPLGQRRDGVDVALLHREYGFRPAGGVDAYLRGAVIGQRDAVFRGNTANRLFGRVAGEGGNAGRWTLAVPFFDQTTGEQCGGKRAATDVAGADNENAFRTLVRWGGGWDCRRIVRVAIDTMHLSRHLPRMPNEFFRVGYETAQGRSWLRPCVFLRSTRSGAALACRSQPTVPAPRRASDAGSGTVLNGIENRSCRWSWCRRRSQYARQRCSVKAKR